MSAFEYRVMEQEIRLPAPPNLTAAIAQFLGNQDVGDWELISVTARPVEPSDRVHGLLYFFKRPAPRPL